MIDRGNYALTHEFLDHQRAVKRLDCASVARYRSYLKHLLLWADHVPYGQANTIRPALGDYLLNLEGRDGNGLAQETLDKITELTKRLLTWGKMHRQRLFRNLPAAWIDDLTPPRSDQSPRPRQAVTIDEMIRIARVAIAPDNLALRRDQAMLALLYTSGCRIGAAGSLPIQAIHLDNNTVDQFPELGVHTKNHKRGTTAMLHIPTLQEIMLDWDKLVRSQLPPSALWLPPTPNTWGQLRLSDQPARQSRNSDLGQRVDLMQRLAGVRDLTPHAYRRGHVTYCLDRCQTPLDVKAMSLNLFHDDVSTTSKFYAPVETDDIRQRIVALSSRSPGPLPENMDWAAVAAILPGLSRADKLNLMHRLVDELAG